MLTPINVLFIRTQFGNYHIKISQLEKLNICELFSHDFFSYMYSFIEL